MINIFAGMAGIDCVGLIFSIVIPYVLGSIPFGLILVKLFGYGDIRSIGSGNIGATNVARTGNKGLALATLILDVLKGVLAVLITRHFAQGEWYVALSSIMVVLGHIFPVWLKFKGGKGIATTFAVYFMMNSFFGIAAISAWIVTFYGTRISSLSSITSLLVVVLVSILMHSSIHISNIFVVAFLSIVVIYKHKDNIKRILNGTEPRFLKSSEK